MSERNPLISYHHPAYTALHRSLRPQLTQLYSMPTNEIAAFVTDPMVDLSWWESRTKNNVLWGREVGLPVTYNEIYTHTHIQQMKRVDV